MMVGLARREPETECAKRYETLRREFGSLGLDANAVIADVRKHVYLRNGRLVLDEAVYLPTGLVLGCRSLMSWLTRHVGCLMASPNVLAFELALRQQTS